MVPTGKQTGEGLWCEERGTGRPLVLLHGWCMSSAVWEGQLTGLSDGYRVIAPDLSGHGRSGLPRDGFTMAGCVEELAGLFQRLDLRDVVLCGWSLGSMIAIRALPQLRGRVAGLVLVGGTPRFTRGDNFPYGLSVNEVEGMARKVERNLRRALDGFIGRMFAESECTDEQTAALVRGIQTAVPLPETGTALQALQVLAEVDLRGELSAIDLPLLVINGNRDLICLPQASDYLAGAIGGARQVVFPGCGHAPFLTDPAHFNRCLEEFMEEVPR